MPCIGPSATLGEYALSSETGGGRLEFTQTYAAASRAHARQRPPGLLLPATGPDLIVTALNGRSRAGELGLEKAMLCREPSEAGARRKTWRWNTVYIRANQSHTKPS